jgi:hypothetical protein
MSVVKYGRSLIPQQPPVPIPVIDISTPPLVRLMVAALVQHQEILASATTRTVVLQITAGKVGLKATFDLPL